MTQKAFLFRWNKHVKTEKSAWEASEGPQWEWWWAGTSQVYSVVSASIIMTSSLFLNLLVSFHVVLGGNRDVRLLAEMEGDGGGHVVSINQGLLFLLLGRSPRSSSRLAKRHWMHERPGMKWNLHPMVMQGGEVIMTSYQELTAGGESSLLFTGCCRAKEVTDRDLDCRTRAELADEAGRPKF